MGEHWRVSRLQQKQLIRLKSARPSPPGWTFAALSRRTPVKCVKSTLDFKAEACVFFFVFFCQTVNSLPAEMNHSADELTARRALMWFGGPEPD